MSSTLKCIAAGCKNHKGQGTFVGDLCAPCWQAITTGRPGPTHAWFGEVSALRKENLAMAKQLNAIRKHSVDIMFLADMILEEPTARQADE